MPRSRLFETQIQRTRQGHVYLKPIKEHAKVTFIWNPSKNMPRSRLFETHQRTRHSCAYLKPIKEPWRELAVPVIWSPLKNQWFSQKKLWVWVSYLNPFQKKIENRDLRLDIGLLIFWEPWLWILRTAFLTDPMHAWQGGEPTFRDLVSSGLW